jgi:exodeoxyribonuclease V alpha subunit
MIAQRQGSSRLPLDPKGRLKTLVGEIMRVAGLELDTNRILKRITALTATPAFNSVIGIGDARLPLIVDDNSLYTERSRYLEQRVAARLAARLATSATAARREVLDDIVARPGAGALSAEQLRAVELALTGSLTVVTGGPGTGKTLVAAAIVRGFARLGVPPIQIALAAQTGKAANRLTEVIGTQLAATA